MLTSEDPVIVGKGLDKFINYQIDRPKKRYARIAENYYRSEHDILNARLIVEDEHGGLIDAGINYQIPHSFFFVQIDQKVQYLLANGVQVEVDNDLPYKDELEEELKEYFDDDFNLAIDEIVEGASIKGAEYMYARTTAQDELKFEASDMLTTDTVFNDLREEVAVVRHYQETVTDGKKEIRLRYAEVYTDDQVSYFIKDEGSKNNRGYALNQNVQPNPRPHVIAKSLKDDEKLLSRSYGRIPFFRMANNRLEESDLKPIKHLIDDYDRIASTMSSILENYDRPLWFVYGANDEDLSKFKERVKAGGAVSVNRRDGGAGVDMQHFKVDVQGRKEVLEKNRESIYNFGMALDPNQSGDGNITNVVIQSRYSLLDLKCNKIEPRIMALLNWALELVREDMQRKGKTPFELSDVTFKLERNVLFNETDTRRRDNIEANTRATNIQSIIMASQYLDDESVIKELCEEFELDFDDVMASLDKDLFKEVAPEGVPPVIEGIKQVSTGTVTADPGDDDDY